MCSRALLNIGIASWHELLPQPLLLSCIIVLCVSHYSLAVQSRLRLLALFCRIDCVRAFAFLEYKAVQDLLCA